MIAFDQEWQDPPANLALSNNDIHVWRTNLNQPTLCFQNLLQTLSPDEIVRAERFYFEVDKKRFIIARGILRTILSYYLGIEPSQIKFCYSSSGKPALAEIPEQTPIYFNLSHSEDIALYAIASIDKIGIDIEYIRFISNIEQLTDRFFSASESAVFRALPSNRKQEAFFNCWTRKEAFVKAIGDGLAFPLNQFDVELSPNAPARLLSIKGDRSAAARWLLQELIPAPNYVAALAVEANDCHLKLWQWLH